MKRVTRFGHHLRHFRKQAGLTKYRLAIQAEVDVSLVIRLESGDQADCQSQKANRLAEVLGCSVSDFHKPKHTRS